MYEIAITRRAEGELRAIPQPQRRRCVAAIERLAEDPRPHGVRKLSGTKADWRVRVGACLWDLYRIDGERPLVTVIRVADRKQAYR